MTPSTSRKAFAWGFRPRHLVMMAAILAVLVVGLYVFVVQSDAYDEAVEFARSNSEIANRVGTVSQVSMRFWDGFHVNYAGSGGDASFVLALRGQREDSVLDVRLKRVANVWRVEEVYLSTKGDKGVKLLPKPQASSPSKN